MVENKWKISGKLAKNERYQTEKLPKNERKITAPPAPKQ
jgi:hypothetical protein